MAEWYSPRTMLDDAWSELIQRGWFGRNTPSLGHGPAQNEDRSGPSDAQGLLDRLYERAPDLFVDHDPAQQRAPDRGPDLDR